MVKRDADRVILITGGTKGIGFGIAETFLETGAKVIVCGRQSTQLLPSAGDNVADFVPADIREASDVEKLFGYVRERYGKLDVLINNAGGTPFSLAANGSARYHASLIDLNLTAPLIMAIHANALMQEQPEGGVILFIGSVGAYSARPGSATYAAAKAGVLSLTKSLAVEWAPKVRVVSVSPGLVQTEQSHLHYGDEDGIAAVSATVPLARMATPRDIGDACLFMASGRAGYVSGVDLLVHGGGESPAFLNAASTNK